MHLVRATTAMFAIVSWFQHCLSRSSDSDIERQLETEIDLREPRSFASYNNKEFLVVRIKYVNTISHYTADGAFVKTVPVIGWGQNAFSYWFETRKPFSSCDMEPSGISTQFDWTLLIPCMFGNPHRAPTTIFVHNYMLPHFVESTLKYMDPSYRFVLVSGGSDMTIPRTSGDVRYKVMRGFAVDATGGPHFQTLLHDPRIIHWFCENHDLNHSKISTLPTGLVYGMHDAAVKNIATSIVPFEERPLKILVSDRVREGVGQWATRARVLKMCQALPEYCVRPAETNAEGVAHDYYAKLVKSVPFIACAHGGGMDPSPKAWEAIMAGTIPIIQRSTLDDAYAKLPVAFVDSWEEVFQPASSAALEGKLRGWMRDLQPFYVAGSALRNKTLHKLTTAYWMDQIHDKLRVYQRTAANVTRFEKH